MKTYFIGRDGEVRFKDEELNCNGAIALPEADPDLQAWLAAGNVLAPAAETLEEKKQRKLAEVNARSTILLAQVKAGYPDDEVQSWPKQEQEARLYLGDNTAATPLLSALSAARGVSVAELASRVVAKSDAFAAISGQIIGTRQLCEDQLAAATTVEEVEAISWPA